jgi:hypothetical protein
MTAKTARTHARVIDRIILASHPVPAIHAASRGGAVCMMQADELAARRRLRAGKPTADHHQPGEFDTRIGRSAPKAGIDAARCGKTPPCPRHSPNDADTSLSGASTLLQGAVSITLVRWSRPQRLG